MATDVTQPFPHDENMQAFEHDGNILIAVVDETYDKSEDDDWEEDREQFRLSLEDEFGVRFEDGNIGPSADFPVFITLLQTDVIVPLWQVVAAAFFLGKPLKDNFEAWRDIGKQLLRFIKRRPAFFNRQGAAVLAFQAVMDEMGGGTPRTLQLRSYVVVNISEPDDLATIDPPSEIMKAPPTLYLGFIRHIFEIEADGVRFRVSVNGTKVEVLRLAN